MYGHQLKCNFKLIIITIVSVSNNHAAIEKSLLFYIRAFNYKDLLFLCCSIIRLFIASQSYLPDRILDICEHKV